MYGVVVELKNGTAAWRAAILTTANKGRTRRPHLAWRHGAYEIAENEASRLNTIFLDVHTDVAFYRVGRLPGTRA